MPTQSNIDFDPDSRIHRRLQAMRLLCDGHTIAQVAEQLGVTTKTVRNWRTRYNQDGIEGLQNKKTGRPRKLTPAQEDKMVRIFQDLQMSGQRLTARYLRECIAILFGIIYAEKAIYPLRDRLGLNEK